MCALAVLQQDAVLVMALHFFGACGAACCAVWDASGCAVACCVAQLVPLPMQACTHPTWRDVAHAGEEEMFMEVSGEWGSCWQLGRCCRQAWAERRRTSTAEAAGHAAFFAAAAQAALCDAEAALSPYPCLLCP